jgi:all-trans-8'-apo-beta-carotenal 15,15'-oxygenase
LSVETIIDAAPLLEHCFLFDALETTYTVGGIAGSIPPWLRGSYFVNGPARFERAGQRMKHWLDGDGMVCSLRFHAGGVQFTSRFVQTRKLKDEEAAGKFLYRGFGTAFPGDQLRRRVMLEPPVNVSVYEWSGKLLVFGEQAVPIELDPVTLETRGEFDFQGSLNEVSPFAAHAKSDPATGNLLNFGVSFSATEPMLNVYEFLPSGELLRRRRHRLQHQHAVHDFGFTANWAVFYLSPLLMDFGRFFNESLSVMESLAWEPEKGSTILIAPRASKAETALSIAIDPKYCLHLINCFEDDGTVVVDILEMDEPIYPEYQTIPDLFQKTPRCRPARYVIDLATRAIRDKIVMQYDLCPDFPAIDTHFSGSHYEDFWMLGIGACGQPGRKFFDQLLRGSWGAGEVCDQWLAPRGEYLGGEPAFIADPANPKEGVVIVEHLLPAQQRAEFLIFDAFQLHAGPIATLPLEHRIHPGFHSSFHFAS